MKFKNQDTLIEARQTSFYYELFTDGQSEDYIFINVFIQPAYSKLQVEFHGTKCSACWMDTTCLDHMVIGEISRHVVTIH